jgi:hypothetical protein
LAVARPAILQRSSSAVACARVCVVRGLRLVVATDLSPEALEIVVAACGCRGAALLARTAATLVSAAMADRQVDRWVHRSLNGKAWQCTETCRF